MEKVLVALSGGVDSAVAIALLKEQGYDVVGIHMALLRNRDFTTGTSRGCCSLDDSNDAREVCEILGVPFYVWDLSKDFQNFVVKDFINQYKIGNTPNPCIRCNQFIKFDTLLKKGIELGFNKIATGHYALSSKNREVGLFRGKNFEKDQSYVLAAMGNEVISKCLFPLGNYSSKQEVRELASKFGLPIKDKPDSTDICFIERGQTRNWLKERLGEKDGEIQDLKGNVLGKHKGAYLYTIGQRNGLDLKNPDPSGRPRYVVKTDILKNLVVIGMKEDLKTFTFKVEKIQQFVEKTAEFVQTRAHGTLHKVLEFRDCQVTVENPIDGIAKGQSCVGYIEDQVIFEATIC